MFFLVLDNLLNWNVLGIRKSFIVRKDNLKINKEPTSFSKLSYQRFFLKINLFRFQISKNLFILRKNFNFSKSL